MCVEILFRFQWKIEKHWSCFCLSAALSSIFSQILIRTRCNQIWWINNIKGTLWELLLDKIWIFLTLAFTFVIVRQNNNKFKKIEFVSNKPSKLWKLSFWNNLSKKRLDEFAQTHLFAVKYSYCSSILDQVNRYNLWLKIWDPPENNYQI